MNHEDRTFNQLKSDVPVLWTSFSVKKAISGEWEAGYLFGEYHCIEDDVTNNASKAPVWMYTKDDSDASIFSDMMKWLGKFLIEFVRIPAFIVFFLVVNMFYPQKKRHDALEPFFNRRTAKKDLEDRWVTIIDF